MQKVLLNDGNAIPAVGFGVSMIPSGGPAYEATLEALLAAYKIED